MRTLLPAALAALLFCLAPALALAAEPILKPGDRVAIIGDSITEQRHYTRFMECYLLACSGVPDVHVFQYGWSGETAGGFNGRVTNDLAGFKPTVATTCYGMNDGGYQAWKPEIGKGYEANMRSCIKKLQELGVRTIVIGSPGVVDSKFFKPGTNLGDKPAHEAYNDTLAHLRDIDKTMAEELKQPFANVFQTMFDAMGPAKAKLGDSYPIGGTDGVHPAPNGHLLMAQAFLQAMGFDGQIALITIDMKGQSTVSTGHKVLGGTAGKIELESTRWPFVFDADPKAQSGTRSILPFTSFNNDLNRFTLVVRNLGAAKGKVTWGDESKEFTAAELEKGVNLAAEFTKTPFDAATAKLVAAVRPKQELETTMIKSVITTFRNIPQDIKDDAEVAAALKTLTDKLHVKHKQLDNAVRATLVPVTHTITVEAVK